VWIMAGMSTTHRPPGPVVGVGVGVGAWARGQKRTRVRSVSPMSDVPCGVFVFLPPSPSYAKKRDKGRQEKKNEKTTYICASS
jgi:hypothetical protein